MKLSVVIQAGGESRRMGTNKALVKFKGRPLIARGVERLKPLADELLVTTNQPESLAFLHLPLVLDVMPGRGALGGLYSALYAARNELVAVVACDLPFVNPSVIEGLAYLAGGEWDIVIPLNNEGQFEPLCAVYRRSTCLPAVKAALDSGERKVISWFPKVKVRKVDASEVAALSPGQYLFFNVNTPEDLELAEQLDDWQESGGEEF